MVGDMQLAVMVVVRSIDFHQTLNVNAREIRDVLFLMEPEVLEYFSLRFDMGGT